MTRKLVRRALFIGLLLPCLYLGTASATFLFRRHSANSARPVLSMAAMSPLRSDARIVVFAPHPDDETLGCAGLILQARSAGRPVTIVFLTNGDGFREGVEHEYRELRVTADDHVRFGVLRRAEALAAAVKLGVSAENVIFLGYPDRGLSTLWTDNWSSTFPYRSPFTGSSSVPYRFALSPRAAFSGERLLQDVAKALSQARPTDVYVTHPSDDHADHSAAASFVQLALDQEKEASSWATGCRLHYYLVHRGDWPVPRGDHAKDALMPPGDMAALDTAWQSLQLSELDTNTKREALKAHASQIAMMNRFLMAFVRRNELFGDLPSHMAPLVTDFRLGEGQEWPVSGYVLMDAVNDNLVRDFERGADIKAVSAINDRTTLYLRIETYRSISQSASFLLGIRYFGEPGRNQAGGRYTVRFGPKGRLVPGDLSSEVQGSTVTIGVPLRDLGYCRRLALGITTSVAGIQVDKTGYRFLRLQ